MAVTAGPVRSTGAGAGDFQRFQARHHDRVHRALALTLGDPDLAAGAVDEAMARAQRRWAEVSRLDNPAGWVYRVGRNWGMSQARRISGTAVRT